MRDEWTNAQQDTYERGHLVKALAASLLSGLATCALFLGLGRAQAPEAMVWGAWSATTSLAAFATGRRWPAAFLRSAIVIAALQPIGFILYAVNSGGLDNPSGSSTGGLVAVGIVSALLLAWAPILVLLGWLGARSTPRTPAIEWDPRDDDGSS